MRALAAKIYIAWWCPDCDFFGSCISSELPAAHFGHAF